MKIQEFTENLKIEAKESITDPIAQEYVLALEIAVGAAIIYWRASSAIPKHF